MGCNCSAGEDEREFIEEGDPSMPTLGYWACLGRGDPIRTLLNNLNIKFNDRQYGFADQTDSSWGAQKDKLGMKIPNLPWWKDGNTIHSETLPIMRSICRKYCPLYLGRNDKEQAYCDSFANTIYGDFAPWFGPYMFMDGWQDRKSAGIEAAKAYLQTINNMLGNKRFIAGHEVTYVDFLAYWILKIIKMYDLNVLKTFPKLVQYMKNFNSLRNIQASEKQYSNIPPFAPICAWQRDNPHRV